MFMVWYKYCLREKIIKLFGKYCFPILVSKNVRLATYLVGRHKQLVLPTKK